MTQYSKNNISALRAKVNELTAALVRQCDNMAFIVNHVELGHWYERFSSELAEDRKALALNSQDRRSK